MANHAEAAYEFIVNGDGERVCDDIPDTACEQQPQNFLKHVVSLTATKTGDGLVDPKLVLTWLLGALGAPSFMIGWLVPIREAGALLPQLIIAGRIRSLPRRKYAWAAGSLLQGAAVITIGCVAVFSEGAAGGWAILGALTVFALARSICSVSYKEVLGKTVSKSTRGTATGTAGSLAAVLVLGYGLLLSTGLLDKTIPVIATALFVAGGLWITASALFATLAEEASPDDHAVNPPNGTSHQVSLLRNDSQLRRFIAVRGLLIATALAPPYLLALRGESLSRRLGELGMFVVASAVATILSSYVWGRFADRSSRQVLIAASLVAMTALSAAAILGSFAPNLTRNQFVLSAILFVLMLAYQGVRLGRSTHLVDMADRDQRLAYTALANTIIGTLLLAGGTFGLVAEAAGAVVVIAIFAVMCGVAASAAFGLHEVQQ